MDIHEKWNEYKFRAWHEPWWTLIITFLWLVGGAMCVTIYITLLVLSPAFIISTTLIFGSIGFVVWFARTSYTKKLEAEFKRTGSDTVRVGNRTIRKRTTK